MKTALTAGLAGLLLLLSAVSPMVAQDRSADEAPAGKVQPPIHPQLIKGLWQSVAEFDEVSVLMAAHQPLETSRVWVRYEFWRFKNGRPASMRTLHEADCRKKSLRAVLAVQYPYSNLQGIPVMPGAAGGWYKPRAESAGAHVVESVCAAEAAASSRARAEGRKNPIETAARDNARFKAAVTGEWHGLAIKDDVKLYVRGAEPAGYARIDVRLERLAPFVLAGQETRSSRHLIELDCETYVYRAVAATAYERNNLKGPELQIARDIEWKPMEGDVFAALGEICDARMESLDALAPLALEDKSAYRG